jgi:hypothetical protein
LEVRDWSVDQVAAFVSSIGFRHYATMMREACIDGFGLVALSLSEMKSAVGIASLGHRRKIRGAIDSILRRQRPKKAGVGGRPASAIKQVFERTLPTSSPFDNDSHSESSVNLTSVASNSRSLQKAEEQLSMLSSQAAKALSKLEQCERRVHLLRQQAPRPDSEGAALAKAKVKVLPGGVVKGDSSGECTFSPNIAPNSRRIIHETRRNTISFNDRMESYLQRKRHNMSEICKEVSHAAGGVVVGGVAHTRTTLALPLLHHLMVLGKRSSSSSSHSHSSSSSTLPLPPLLLRPLLPWPTPHHPTVGKASLATSLRLCRAQCCSP